MQLQDEFYNFIKNLELNLEYTVNTSSFLMTVLGGFNARKQGWCQNEVKTLKRPKIDTSSSRFSLGQIIKQPTHILSNSAFSIDLIFTSSAISSELSPSDFLCKT